MYADGLEIFFEYPIFGVGLSNFGAYFRTGQYSHSDIMEPLATTGLFGFILYQSFYLLLIARVWRLLKCAGNDSTRYRLRMILLGVLTILVLGLGTPHYTSAPVFLLLTAFSVSTTEMDGWVGGGRAPAGQQIRWYGDTGLVARRPVTRVFPKGGNW
jgi:O-antigen ligase